MLSTIAFKMSLLWGPLGVDIRRLGRVTWLARYRRRSCPISPTSMIGKITDTSMELNLKIMPYFGSCQTFKVIQSLGNSIKNLTIRHMTLPG